MPIIQAIKQQIEHIEERVARAKRISSNILCAPDTKAIRNDAMHITSLAQVLETMCHEHIDGKTEW